MFRNFFVVTLRNLRKNSLYSFINISGLAIGLVCGVLIMLWVADETSFDKFIPKYEKLYQVWVNAEFDGKVNSWISVPQPTYQAMKTADSRIINSCVTGWGGTRLITYEDKRIMKRGYFASKEFLQMFEYDLLKGSRTEAMEDPSSIVITESLAKALFGDEDPINKVVKVDDESLLKVTAILKDIPGNSSFEFDYLIPWKHRESISDWVVRNKTNWGNYSFQVFVELNDKESFQEAQTNIEDMLTENGQTDIPRKFFLHPMEKWRLYSTFENGEAKGGRSDFVQLFTVIAIFILVIACINFMNLATARSEKRAREVGIRKSLGSQRPQIIGQFLGESVMVALFGYLVALILVLTALPWYNDLVEKELSINFLSVEFWAYSVLGVLAIGIVSGSYPAFYLSSFNPVKTLKGTIKIGKGGTTPRKVLVVLQFGFSILLMISTVVIFQQISLVKNRELGYNQENLINLGMSDDLDENFDVFKQELLRSGAVEAVTRSNSAITQINSNNFLGWPGKPENLRVIFTTIATEYDYTKTMGIKVLQGRDFSKDFASDTAAIVINKAALDLMGLEDPIGTSLDLWGSKRKLIGVIDNVIMGSPYREVKPLFMVVDPDWGGSITIRLTPKQNQQENLAKVQEIFEQYNPAYPFEYQFTDVEYQKKFTTINLTIKLASIFSFLAIIITGLGLFGLAAFTAEQRIKEIGIRKVLGASVISLVSLISRDFSKLVLIAFVIATPVTWYLLDGYLERYPIHVSISWWIFPLAGVVALSFALLIVSNQAYRAASVNPAKSLRNE